MFWVPESSKLYSLFLQVITSISGSCEQIHIIGIQVLHQNDQQKKLFVYTSLIAKENDQFSRKIRRIRSVQKPNFPLATNISYYTIWCVVSLGVLTSPQGTWIYKEIITDQSNSKNLLAYFRTTSFAQRYQEKNCCLYNRKLMRQVMWYNSKRSDPIELRIEM